jgi:oxygen-dependent protoporphyrinogen oxidase
MDAPHAIVIGGGLAGLAAGFRLRGQGLRVTLLERESEPGGRARSLASDGFTFDAGAQVLAAAAPAFERLAREAGAADALLPLRPLASLRFVDGRPQPLAPWCSGDAARLRERLGLARLERIEGRFLRILARGASERGERLDDRSVAELAALYLPSAALEGWVAPLAASLGLGDPARASRIALMRLHAAGALAPVLPRGGLGALAAALARGLDTRFGCGAVGIEPAGRGLRVALAGGGPPLEADAVVVATPARAALELADPLLTPPEREVLGAAATVPAVVLHAPLERSLAGGGARIGIAPSAGLPVAAFLHEPGGVGSLRVPEGRAAASLVAAPAWSEAQLGAPDDTLAKELLALLDRIQPGASRSVSSVRVSRHPDAYPLFPVGRYRALARLRRVQDDRRALGRRLYLAGDHLAGPTVEDALLSGLRAAADLAADLGRP